MSILTNPIGWCDDTTNAVTGCDKVSPGCRNCYAEAGTRARVLRAQGIETWGSKGVRHPVAEFAKKIRRLNGYKICDRCHYLEPIGGDDCRKCSASTLRRIRLFADSNSDWLDKKWKVETHVNLLREIYDAPNVDIQLLTKRAENFKNILTCALASITDGTGKDGEFWQWICDWIGGKPPKNVWLGVSVENQEMADLRIRQLLQIPAAVRFLSCEPLLGEIRFTARNPFPIYSHIGKPCCTAKEGFHKLSGAPEKNESGISWIIVGGESGDKRRDVPVEAILGVADQCNAAGVPVYVKQDTAFKSGQQGRIPAEYWAMKEFPR